MKILFIYPAYESLAIEHLSAVAKARGHQTALVFDPRLFNDTFVTARPLARVFNARARVIREALAHKPDLIAFSVTTSDFPWFADIAAALRPLTKSPIVVGNIHATSAPEYVLKHPFVDAIVRGEGEDAFGDLLDSLADGGIRPDLPNLGIVENGAVRLNPLRPIVTDLDQLPFADKHIFAGTSVRPRDVFTVMASRGCPYNCSFCNNNLLRRLYGAKDYVRLRSVGHVIEELERARADFGIQRVNFYDEVFGIRPDWLEEFAQAYPARVGLPYIACTNPNVVTERYAELLSASGCRKVDMGVQTVNAEKRRLVYHRRETNDQIRRAIETLRRHRVIVAAENVTNFPGESESDLVEMAHFYNETRPDIVKIFWLRCFPATEMVGIALKSGAITPADVEDINEGRNVGSIAVGGKAASLQRKFYALIALIPLAPPRVIDAILRRRLYRFIPASLIPGFAYTLVRLLTGRDSDSEMMMRQHAGRYRMYLTRRFFPQKP